MNAISTFSHYPIQSLVLSHSSREMFRNCARKLEFRQFFGSPPHRQENYAGDCGNAMHRGVGKFLITRDENAAIFEFLLHFPHELELLKPEYEKRSMEACLVSMLSVFNSHYLSPYDVAKIRVNVSGETREEFCVEVPFAIEITGAPLSIPVFFVGYLDCILYNQFKKQYIVVDLKTTRQKTDDARFQFDEQVIPYAIVLEHALGQSIEELDISYFSVYVDLMEPKPEMISIKKTQQDVQDWHRGLCDDIKRLASYHENAWFPRATDGKSCVTWNRKCQFFEDCHERDPVVLARVIQGKPRVGMFSNGDVPWITATLPYVGR